MPFTPFHMGPGAAVKAVAGRYFSLTVFGFSQVMIDLEPLIRLFRGDSVLHGMSHTYLGALVIGAVALLAGKPLCEWWLRGWNRAVDIKYLRWLMVNPNISWLAASLGAFIGTLSHVLLDSVMHADMHPFAPFSYANQMLHLIPAGQIYLLCTILGVAGFIALAVVALWHKHSFDTE
ncbi:MAG: DUF4184 domain-containing protein [Chromatiales bacterium]|nr:DUF4184 domain-containing protein [Chromatiales bacterium]